MKKVFPLLTLLAVLSLLCVGFAYAQEEVEENDVEQYPSYTMEDVEQRNTPDDCWMVFEDGVYDFSEYLPDHDKFMDIREWCGMDMTQDFKDKAGAGRDHREGTYGMLEQYYIGSLENGEGDEQEDSNGDFKLVDIGFVMDDSEDDQESMIQASPREYNILIPFVLTTVLFWGSYILVKKGKFLGMTIHKFNAFWNTVLLLTLLIPGMAFGIFMIVRIQRPELWDINFDFMYWHVELSLVMGFVAIYHFIQRIPQFLGQMKSRK